jgi:hypothetical protein
MVFALDGEVGIKALIQTRILGSVVAEDAEASVDDGGV